MVPGGQRVRQCQGITAIAEDEIKLHLIMPHCETDRRGGKITNRLQHFTCNVRRLHHCIVPKTPTLTKFLEVLEDAVIGRLGSKLLRRLLRNADAHEHIDGDCEEGRDRKRRLTDGRSDSVGVTALAD